LTKYEALVHQNRVCTIINPPKLPSTSLFYFLFDRLELQGFKTKYQNPWSLISV